MHKIYFCNFLSNFELKFDYLRNYFLLLGFIVWVKSEIGGFVKIFSTQVFAGKTNFSTVAECVNEARTCCEKLRDVGCDVTFVLDAMLEKDIRKLVQEAGDCQIEAVKHRAKVTTNNDSSML